MFAIAGATGHVGSAAAAELLARKEEIVTLVRDPAKGERWSRAGAGVAVADLTDRSALAEALKGCDGFFALLPSDFASTEPDTAHRRLVDAIAGAVRDSGVPHVVLLSSMGADLAEGTGPVRYLHELEEGLRGTRTVLSALRCCHFQEKAEILLPAVQGAGIYPVFAESADVAVPMVATRDIGATAAEALLNPPSAHETVDVLGPEYTERQVAGVLADLLGGPLQVATLPRAAWVDTLADTGLPRPVAVLLAELCAADEDGLLRRHGDRSLRGTTGIEETLREVLRAARAEEEEKAR